VTMCCLKCKQGRKNGRILDEDKKQKHIVHRSFVKIDY
jgi:hypothetical protein